MRQDGIKTRHNKNIENWIYADRAPPLPYHGGGARSCFKKIVIMVSPAQDRAGETSLYSRKDCSIPIFRILSR